MQAIVRHNFIKKASSNTLLDIANFGLCNNLDRNDSFVGYVSANNFDLPGACTAPSGACTAPGGACCASRYPATYSCVIGYVMSSEQLGRLWPMFLLCNGLGNSFGRNRLGNSFGANGLGNSFGRNRLGNSFGRNRLENPDLGDKNCHFVILEKTKNMPDFLIYLFLQFPISWVVILRIS